MLVILLDGRCNNMQKKFISFVVPTYNRQRLLVETIESIVSMDKAFLSHIEVIVVDDASTDGTHESFKAKYEYYLSRGIFKYILLDENIGVTGAKNHGVKNACGDWVVFLDSDDLLYSERFEKLFKDLVENKSDAGIFYRCEDFDGNLIGIPLQPKSLVAKNYFAESLPGECLPVFRREVMLEFPYNTDLRGFESVAYAKILSEGYSIHVSDIVMRKYRTDNNDRLSKRTAIFRRAEKMATGYKLMNALHKKSCGRNSSVLLIKFLAYKFLGVANKIISH